MRNEGELTRSLGTGGAVFLGLGSIVGTGIYVSVGIAAGIAGPGVLFAIAIAALVAACNGLSSAQLAAIHPVSGGTYEYANRQLNPIFGFSAGWMFLFAKSASAATAALGFAGYLLGLFGIVDRLWSVAIALLLVVLVTALVAGGIRRSSRTNVLLVSVAVGVLVFFVVLSLVTPEDLRVGTPFRSIFAASDIGGLSGVLRAAAIMFVAYTGYGRVATLGEEVRAPERTIPRAIIVTVSFTMLLYLAVAAAGIRLVGSEGLAGAVGRGARPLEAAARASGFQAAPLIVAVGALTALVGVVLNLILGLSRVVLAMARRGDMPRGLGKVATSAEAANPIRSVLVTGFLVGAITLVGNVGLTWTFSAFTVLIYYALANLSALTVGREGRFVPRAVSLVGLLACLGLAVFVPLRELLAGLSVLAVGILWHVVARRLSGGRE